MTGRRSHGRLSALNGVVHQGSEPVQLDRLGLLLLGTGGELLEALAHE